jgi:hypothetical protein
MKKYKFTILAAIVATITAILAGIEYNISMTWSFVGGVLFVSYVGAFEITFNS